MECEKRSVEVLGAIRRVIDGLRSAPNHTWQSQPTTATKEQEHGGGILLEGSLMAHLNSIGVVQLVNELHDQQYQQQQQQHQNPGDNFPDASLGSFLRKHDNSNERKQILIQFIIPLLRQLEQCYAIMDELSTPSPSAQLSDTTKSNYKNKAPPPLGMLSLNDYTNVACLLEFATSISLIPLLEHPTMYLPPLTQSTIGNNSHSVDIYMQKIELFTTFMIQKRNLTIPKSLAGRISKMILTWGTLYATYHHVVLYENLIEGQYFSSDTSIILRQSYRFYRIFQAYNEMTILACSIGRLLLLDRFRPMLLSRHLSDVYLTLFIAERLRWYLSKSDSHVPCMHSMFSTLVEIEKITEKGNHENLQSLQISLLFTTLPFPSSVISTLPIQTPPRKRVDCREAALAYRTLLSGGASMVISGTSSPAIPTWLRIRIGQSLTKLAQEDIRSVVEVFVASARSPGSSDDGNTITVLNDDIMTGAAARLACALCTEPMSIDQNSTPAKRKSLQFQEQLWSQFVSFLVVEGQSPSDLMTSRSSVAMHLTLWATISQLPMETLQACFVRKLVSGLIPAEETNSPKPTLHQLSALQSISAIARWLSMIPTSLDVQTEKKVKNILLEPYMTIHGRHVTVLGQVLRLEESFSCYSPLVEEVGKTNVNFSSEGKVNRSLALILTVLCRISGSKIQSCNDPYNSIALELLTSVSSNDLDKKGYCFVRSEVEKEEPCIMVYRRTNDVADFSDLTCLIGTIENRVKCLVRAFVTLSQSWEARRNQNNDSDASVDKLVSSLFRLALLLHYASLTKSDCDDQLINRTLELNNLLENEKNELKMVASVALATMSEGCPIPFLLGIGQKNDDCDTSVLEVLGLIVKLAAARSNVGVAKDDADDESELISTASIVLSLLVALLELGAKKRSKSDEAFFMAILPSLHMLASVNNEEGSLYSPARNRSMPELAEMASHAMALIVARGEVVKSEGDVMPPSEKRKNTRMGAILYKLSQAERDLQSTQPPIRAKGVVTLRHIARSLEHLDPSKLSPGALMKNALITDMSEPTSKSVQTLSAKEELALISRTLARICLNVLADPESYVYLASIQTLVAIGDVCPSEIMPMLGIVIASGRLSIIVATVDANLEPIEVSLSPEQRIKATEALIFMIRRRGDGIFLYGSSLLNTMLFGEKQWQNGHGFTMQNDDQTAQLIRSQTHFYFTGDKSNTVDDDIDEKKIRLNTGGPIFSMEETHLLRAAAISVVCELVSTLKPTTIAVYCHILVKLATDAMQLDTSRPVRRVAACLARDLYACVMRELTTSEANVESTCSMTIAIVDASEEKLYNLLTRCVAADELSKKYFVDPTTQCRSQEAIDIRQELESMGVLQSAAFVLLKRSKYPESMIRKLSVYSS